MGRAKERQPKGKWKIASAFKFSYMTLMFEPRTLVYFDVYSQAGVSAAFLYSFRCQGMWTSCLDSIMLLWFKPGLFCQRQAHFLATSFRYLLGFLFIQIQHTVLIFADSTEVPHFCLGTVNWEMPSCTDEHKLFVEFSKPLSEVAEMWPFCSVIHSYLSSAQIEWGTMNSVTVKSLILGCRKASGSFGIDLRKE